MQSGRLQQQDGRQTQILHKAQALTTSGIDHQTARRRSNMHIYIYRLLANVLGRHTTAGFTVAHFYEVKLGDKTLCRSRL